MENQESYEEEQGFLFYFLIASTFIFISFQLVKFPLNEKDTNYNFYMDNNNVLDYYNNNDEMDEKSKKKRYEYLYDLVKTFRIKL